MRQIDPIYTPQLMSAEDPLRTHIGGSVCAGPKPEAVAR